VPSKRPVPPVPALLPRHNGAPPAYCSAHAPRWLPEMWRGGGFVEASLSRSSGLDPTKRGGGRWILSTGQRQPR